MQVNAITMQAPIGTGGALKVIDSHFHIWDPEVENLPWLKGMNAINHKFTFEELEAEYAQFDVEFLGGVYVEVDCVDHELEDKLIFENPNDRILARMLRSRVSPYMRVPLNATGIREPLHIDSEPRGRCAERSFIEGLEAMADKGLPFELCNRGDELADMAQAFALVPQETVIIDHMGNVPGLDETSRNALKAMAALPNSYIKTSGDNPVNPDIVKFIRDTFAPDRLLYASNWPVVTSSSSFAKHFQLMLDIFGNDEDFFMNNAKKAYGISL